MAVAEALLDIYSGVGIPEEVLTDQGTQFMFMYAGSIQTIQHKRSHQYAIPPHLKRIGLKMEQNHEVHALEALSRPTEAVSQTDQPCSVCI